jgi:3-methyladenine DNA glycosylase/8-oxoguanine DNA glycosylase
MSEEPARQGRWPVVAPYDLGLTTRFLRTGGGDPTFRREPDGFWRASWTPDGPATLRVGSDAEGVWGMAWGPGADAALAAAPRLLGLHEDPWQLDGHPVVERLLREHPGLRMNDTGDVFEALVITVLQQLVTWEEAVASYRKLVERCGEPAPGPAGLLLPPTPRAVRDASMAALVACGVAERRVQVLRDAASYARRLQGAAEMSSPDAMAHLQKLPGIGPWTASSVLGHRLGRPDVALTGDLHLPRTVAYVLTGRAEGDDEAMLALLAPYEGQIFRVQRLIMMAGPKPPRRSPKPTLWANR